MLSNVRRLPDSFPAGTKYVIEARGPLVHRYLAFPDGRLLELGPRKALTCSCKARQELGLDRSAESPRRKPAAA